jgi:hypothetical protein
MSALSACAASELLEMEILFRTFHTLAEALGKGVQLPLAVDSLPRYYNGLCVIRCIH